VTAVEHEVSPRTQRVKAQLAADDPGRELWPGMRVDVRIERLAAELEPFRSQPADPPPRTPNEPRELFVCPPAGQVLAVPETAVLDAGGRRVVYLERMPGMFDCVEVVMGARCGGFYPVISGVARGQRVATAGAFLIDAESRLNPSVAAGYFGAARGDAGVPAPENSTPAADAKGPSDADAEEIRQALAQLRPAERLAAERQKSCPVTGMLLGSMGAPIKTRLAGREIWLCCEGCQAAAEKEPRKYLGKLSGLAKP
jgi:hypothetical protein